MLPGALRHDENVHLPGSAMAAWIARMVNDEEVTVPGSVTVSVSATVPGSMRALAATMYEDHGISWCDACQLFALHEPGVIPYPPAWLPTTPGEVANVWAACGQGRLAEYVGAPPEPQLNMRTADCSVCPPRSYLELSTGDCVDCPPGQVPATWSCVPCPAATYAAADGTCQPCPTNHISVRGVCVPCGHVETVDYATNSCVACAPDVELDLRDVAAACDPATVTMERAAHPGDNCPDRLVVRVTGVMEVGSGLTTELATYWDPDDQGPGACTDDRAGFSLVDASGNEWSYRRSGGTYNEFVSQEYCYLIADGTEYCVDTIQTDPSCRWPSFRDLRGPNTATLMIEPPASPRVVFELRPLVWPAACEVELR